MSFATSRMDLISVSSRETYPDDETTVHSDDDMSQPSVLREQVQKLNELLESRSWLGDASTFGDDDDLNSEINRLNGAEQMLQAELEQAEKMATTMTKEKSNESFQSDGAVLTTVARDDADTRDAPYSTESGRMEREDDLELSSSSSVGFEPRSIIIIPGDGGNDQGQGQKISTRKLFGTYRSTQTALDAISTSSSDAKHSRDDYHDDSSMSAKDNSNDVDLSLLESDPEDHLFYDDEGEEGDTDGSSFSDTWHMQYRAFAEDSSYLRAAQRAANLSRSSSTSSRGIESVDSSVFNPVRILISDGTNNGWTQVEEIQKNSRNDGTKEPSSNSNRVYSAKPWPKPSMAAPPIGFSRVQGTSAKIDLNPNQKFQKNRPLPFKEARTPFSLESYVDHVCDSRDEKSTTASLDTEEKAQDCESSDVRRSITSSQFSGSPLFRETEVSDVQTGRGELPYLPEQLYVDNCGEDYLYESEVDAAEKANEIDVEKAYSCRPSYLEKRMLAADDDEECGAVISDDFNEAKTEEKKRSSSSFGWSCMFFLLSFLFAAGGVVVVTNLFRNRRSSVLPSVLPVNNNCGGALGPLHTNSSLTYGSTFGATFDVREKCDGDDGFLDDLGRGVWYQVQGNGLMLTASTCHLAGFDTHVSVFQGECDRLICVDANDAFKPSNCGEHSFIAWPSTIDTTYYIYVRGIDSNEGGEFVLTTGEIMINDSCEVPVGPIPSDGTAIFGSTMAARYANAPVCESIEYNGRGQWYQVVGTGVEMVASTCKGTSFDTQISIYEGSCAALQCVAANRDSCDKQSKVTWTSEAGQMYYILVHGEGNAAGEFALKVSSLDVSIDSISGLCEMAYGPLPTDDYALVSSTAFSVIQDVPLCENFPVATNGVWYWVEGNGKNLTSTVSSEVAPQIDVNSELNLTTSRDNGISHQIHLYAGKCDELNPVEPDVSSCVEQTSVSWTSILGEAYYLLVLGTGESHGQFELQLSQSQLKI